MPIQFVAKMLQLIVQFSLGLLRVLAENLSIGVISTLVYMVRPVRIPAQHGLYRAHVGMEDVWG
jgi:hypothetical protein